MKVNNNLFFLIIIFAGLLFMPVCHAEPANGNFTKCNLKQLDSKIAKRLNLSDEQIKVLSKNRTKNLNAMEDTIKKMEVLRKKIHNVYVIGIPKYQADIKTAPMKMELAILKQNADKIRNENRKNFESILTPEQKIEFEKFKAELTKQNQNL